MWLKKSKTSKILSKLLIFTGKLVCESLSSISKKGCFVEKSGCAGDITTQVRIHGETNLILGSNPSAGMISKK